MNYAQLDITYITYSTYCTVSKFKDSDVLA